MSNLPMCSELYTQQEQDDRMRFIAEFGKYFTKYVYMPISCHYDIKATGNTGEVFMIEIKVRKYSVNAISASTMIEGIKLNDYKAEYRLHRLNNVRIIYFNYCTNGYLSFDLSSRYMAGSSEVLYTYSMNLPSKTLESKGNSDKNVGSLMFDTSGNYHDRMKVY